MVLGRPGGWLEREARDLGLGWYNGSDGSWLGGLAAMVAQGHVGDWATPYGRWLLGEGFAGYAAQLLLDAHGGEPVTIG